MTDIECEANNCYWNVQGDCINHEIKVKGNPPVCASFITNEEAEKRLIAEMERDWIHNEAVFNEGFQTAREQVLAIINDWDEMADPDYEGDGEAEFQAKYGMSTTDLVQVIQKALEQSK